MQRIAAFDCSTYHRHRHLVTHLVIGFEICEVVVARLVLADLAIIQYLDGQNLHGLLRTVTKLGICVFLSINKLAPLINTKVISSFALLSSKFSPILCYVNVQDIITSAMSV